MDNHIVISMLDVKKVLYVVFAFGMCVMYLWLVKYWFREVVEGMGECRDGSYGEVGFSPIDSDNP